jgi:uncharacterized protein YndB with AHSA1/START domain
MLDLNRDVSSTTDREIVLTRLLDAPRALVFEAWTKPEHLDRWWGPRGFRTATDAMDVRPGGSWRYVMRHDEHGSFDNLITYREVVPDERLVYSHGTNEESPEEFHVTVTFADEGGKTRLGMRMVWPTPEALEAVRKYGVGDGGNQTLDRLAEFLAERA